jgi:hypothetical protein
MLAVRSLSQGCEPALPRPLPSWLGPVWAILMLGLWWLTLDTTTTPLLARGDASIPIEAVRFGIAMAVAVRLVASLLETTFYRSWWRLRGRTLPFGALWLWLLGLSILDMFARLLPTLFADDGSPIGVAGAVLCGIRPLISDAEGVGAAARVIFGPLCVMTLGRIGLTAWLQARATGARFPGVMAFTLLVWLVTRVLAWWVSELARGQSPLAGGSFGGA